MFAASLPTALFAFPLPEPWGYVLIGTFLLAVMAVTWIMALRLRLRKQMDQIRLHYEKQLELESRLRQGQKLEAIGQLAGGIAHDFNNLLTVINGCAELLDGTLPAGSAGQPARDLVADIRRAGERATGLTGQLLLFGRQSPANLTVLNLNVVVADAVRLLGRVLGETVRLETSLDGDLPPVKADVGLIHQIVLNLAVNARDAMPAGGTLRILTESIDRTDGQRVRLTIADSGTGMDEATQKKIFEPFFTTKAIGKGTGLGLATVYGIVQSIGGEIRFQSKVGAGTTFEIDFPAVAPASDSELIEEAAYSPSTDDLTPIPSHGTVLLVEDDALVRGIAVKVLRKNGYLVHATGSVTEGVRLAREVQRLDLLLTDVVMPQLSGPEVARLVRQFQPGIRVVYFSGYSAEAIARLGIELDEAGFIHKPFTAQSLMQGVRASFSQTIPEFELDAID